MNKVTIASMREGAGKTSVIVGIAESTGKRIGYMKPLGDRPVYKDKKLLDYDCDLMADLYGLKDDPQDMCFGFDHSKLAYAYSDGGTRKRLLDAVAKVGSERDALFIEGGKDLMHGTYVHLGSLSIAKHTGSKLVVVLSGNPDSIVDDSAFLKKYIDRTQIDLCGVVANKIKELKEFEKGPAKLIAELGLNLLGIIPHQEELTRFSVRYLADTISAKVITGDDHLDTVIEDILVGAMSVDTPLQKILSQNKNILMITSGDRSDMILAAIERDTKAILLSNNIIPPSNIISKAEDRGVPMLLVPYDTFRAAKQIDDMPALLSKNDKDKLKLLGKLSKKNLRLDEIIH